MNEIVSYLLTLLAGTVVGGLFKFFQDAYNRHEDMRAIAAAVEAEISVCLEGIRDGQFIEMCTKVIAHVSTPGHIVTADDYLDVALPQTPCPVFNSHLSKLGLLGKATGPVVKTCQLYETACLDLRHVRDRHTRLPLNAKQLAAYHESMKLHFEEILKIGEVAIGALQLRTVRWWRRLGCGPVRP